MKSKRKVEVETAATVFERSEHRPVIISIEPERGIVGFRLKGTSHTHYLTAGAGFSIAAKADAENSRKGRSKRV